MKFRYTYDFGDGWEHEIEVEEIQAVDPEQKLPQCIKGKRACPPEHIGGAWGYQALLEAKAKPTHPERKNFERYIETYNPEAFDLDMVNQKLAKIK
ncbi:MAG: plasmid pRiA4b ORF-3 family protein [Anaerolineales bacterium]|nr:plasmid pRiA4b ORF-3 family protein [Anaerolineales bacterium]